MNKEQTRKLALMCVDLLKQHDLSIPCSVGRELYDFIEYYTVDITTLRILGAGRMQNLSRLQCLESLLKELD